MRISRLFLSAMLLVFLLMAACSDDDDVGPNSAGGTPSVAQALAVDEGSEAAVSGFLVTRVDGSVRLCSQSLKSSPPQCGGDRIELIGFNSDSVPGAQHSENPGEIGTLIWTNAPITVTGTRTSEGLAVGRLSAVD